MRKLYIVGARGFGREVAWLVERINNNNPTWTIEGFIDDNKKIQGSAVNGYPVVGGTDYLLSMTEEVWVVCAIGSAKIKKTVIDKLVANPYIQFATLIDPSVIMSEIVTVGEGTVICAGSILTVNISLGKHVIVNLDCTIGHDAVLNDYVTLYPSVTVSGNVTVRECVEIGTGTQIIQGKNICANCIIGAGAVVVKDINEPGTYVGIPVVKKHSN